MADAVLDFLKDRGYNKKVLAKIKTPSPGPIIEEPVGVSFVTPPKMIQMEVVSEVEVKTRRVSEADLDELGALTLEDLKTYFPNMDESRFWFYVRANLFTPFIHMIRTDTGWGMAEVTSSPFEDSPFGMIRFLASSKKTQNDYKLLYFDLEKWLREAKVKRIFADFPDNMVGEGEVCKLNNFEKSHSFYVKELK